MSTARSMYPPGWWIRPRTWPSRISSTSKGEPARRAVLTHIRSVVAPSGTNSFAWQNVSPGGRTAGVFTCLPFSYASLVSLWSPTRSSATTRTHAPIPAASRRRMGS
jgi:hypothetical protein